jgi:hypothetical protein
MTIRTAFIVTLAASLLLAGSSAVFSDGESDVVAKRLGMASGKPYTSVVPRMNEPTGWLTVLTIWPDSPTVRVALASLQGIVNRDDPKLYLGMDKVLSWAEYHSGKIKIKIEPDVYKIFETYKDKPKGMVVYDTTLDAECNIAITYAGVDDLIPVTADLAEDFSKRYGWKVVQDLRGRWTNRVEAYKWSLENLFPRCTKFALMHYDFTPTPLTVPLWLEGGGHRGAASVDYAVASRMFVWFIGNRPLPGEMELANKVMESVPFYTPVVGASGGSMYDEPALVSYVASFANLHIPLYSYNCSVLSGIQIPDRLLKQKKLPPPRDFGPDKIYITFTNSEHDNMGHVIGGGPPWDVLGFETDDPYRIFWCDPMRGQVPVGWPIGPLLCELAPTVLARIVLTQTDNDCLMAALSGICLTDLPGFASAYPKSQDDLLAGYSKLSGQYMKRLGWTTVNPWGPPGGLRTFVKNIPGLEGVFEGYTGRLGGGGYDRANYLLEGVPVFHALTYGIAGEGRQETISESYTRRAKILVDQIMAVKTTERPAFIHAWTIGWDYCPTILKMAADQLPKDYVVVRPDEMAALFKKYKGSKVELKSFAANPKPSGVVTETSESKDGLIIDTGKIKVEIAWGATPQAPIKRIMGVDGKWRCEGRLLQYNEPVRKVTGATYERTKNTDSEKDYLLTYTYDNGNWMTLKLRAIAGRPYILVEDESNRGDLPTWSIHLEKDFQPDILYQNTGDQPITYAGSDVLGELPWKSWLLAGRTDSRDMIGYYTLSWGDWNNGNILLWRVGDQAYLEDYHQRAGIKRFAVAALDRNDPKAARRIWNELNGK